MHYLNVIFFVCCFVAEKEEKNAILNAFYAPCNEELVLLKGPLLTEVGFIEGFNKRSLELTLPIPFCPNHADSSLMLLSDIILLFYYYYALFFFFFFFWHPIAFLSPRCYFFVIFWLFFYFSLLTHERYL